jgi:hypothetical protein
LDIEMDRAMRAYAQALLPGSVYKSEESDSGINLVAQTDIVRVDPIDGTTNLVTLHMSYAVVILIERVRSDGSIAHVAGAIYSSTGEVVSWGAVKPHGVVRIDFPSFPSYADDTELMLPEADKLLAASKTPRSIILKRQGDGSPSRMLRPGIPTRVAAVAASPKRRAELEKMYDLGAGDLWLSTIGGNPLAAALLVGDLGAIIETERILLHDCAYLVPLRLLGGKVTSHDGFPIDVFEAFESSREPRMMEPFVAAVNSEVAESVRRWRRPRGL